MKRNLLVAMMVCFAMGRAVASASETEAQHDARMEWFRDARFGMFIHWGLYSIPAGEWNGQTNHAEWIRHTAKIPIDQYNGFVNEFNPTNFNAMAWARMARKAGMKYLVITSKHHDGFCLWDSKLTDFDVMSTPFKRDILKELSRACKREGIQFCTYHSIMDWHHPDYLPRREWEVSSRPVGDADYSRYVAYLRGELKEIVQNYHPGILWFDGEWESTWTHEMGLATYNYVRGLDPRIIINNRVDKGRKGMHGFTQSGGYAGDYGTPEQEIPATGMPGLDWESCMTMNAHWGWNKFDNKWKSSDELVRKLIDIASKGGNFLLNIGPRPDGTFPDQAVERLEAIGQWMSRNSESVYGTQASPFKDLPWGRCTQKKSWNSTKLYLHVFDWPAKGQLLVPGLLNQSAQARVLTTRQPLTVGYSPEGMTISVPETAPDPVSSTIVVNIQGDLRIKGQGPIWQGADGSAILPAKEAQLEGGDIRFEADRNCIGFWTNPADAALWNVELTSAGKFDVAIEYAAVQPTSVLLQAEGSPALVSLAATGDYQKFQVLENRAVLSLPAGQSQIKLKAVPDGWNPANVRSIKLTRKQ